MTRWTFGPMPARVGLTTTRDRLRLLAGQVATLLVLLALAGWLNTPVASHHLVNRTVVTVTTHPVYHKVITVQHVVTTIITKKVS